MTTTYAIYERGRRIGSGHTVARPAERRGCRGLPSICPPPAVKAAEKPCSAFCFRPAQVRATHNLKSFRPIACENSMLAGAAGLPLEFRGRVAG